jgi:hypothetical protein
MTLLQVGCVNVVERLQSSRNLCATLRPDRPAPADAAPDRLDTTRRTATPLNAFDLHNTAKDPLRAPRAAGAFPPAAAGTRRRNGVAAACVTRAPAADRFLKVHQGSADNHNMGHTPLQQRKTPGNHTEKVGA